jgi:phosphoribosylglycinamide formyltransferase-1
VADDDDPASLSARILAEEHRAYPAALARLLAEPWRVEGRRLVFAAATGAGGRGETRREEPPRGGG